jgi:hypothetical protein
MLAWVSVAAAAATPPHDRKASGFASTTIVHGREGAGFPWRSAYHYQMNIPEPTTCQYTFGQYPRIRSLLGEVPAAQSPAAFKGTLVELLLDALLGMPTRDVDFALSCTSLEQPGLPDGGASNGVPAPDKFQWIKPKRPSTHAEILRARRHANNGDDSGNYAQRQRRQHYRSTDNMGQGHDLHHNATFAPTQPPIASALAQEFEFTSFLISLTTDDVKLNRSLTQADFANWGERCSQRTSVPSSTVPKHNHEISLVCLT